MKRLPEILDNVSAYYTDKIIQHGPTAQGTDWNSESSRDLRFSQFLRLLPQDESYSILDYGCGYGALYSYLNKAGHAPHYQGFDISEKMIEVAKTLHSPTSTNPKWNSDKSSLTPVDYVVASGVFNVKLHTPLADWETYLKGTLEIFNQLSTKGFAFNILTSYSDPPFMRDDLYYASPEDWFGYCKTHFSPRVALLHDYRLYEFTLIVRKDL